MADQLPLFPFTSQEDWYGELVFTSADDGSTLSLAGRTFEMPVTQAVAGVGTVLVAPVITLTMNGGGLALKDGAPNTIVFRVPRTTAQGFARGEYTADVLEVVDGERHVFMPVRIAYTDPSGLRSFSSRFVGAGVSFSARTQPIVTPVAIAGRQGAPGATIITGLVPPLPADGRDGDFWIEDRTATSRGRRMYGPKAAGAWPGTPWTIQVAGYADVPGLGDVLGTLLPADGDGSNVLVRATGAPAVRKSSDRANDFVRWEDYKDDSDSGRLSLRLPRLRAALADKGGGHILLPRGSLDFGADSIVEIGSNVIYAGENSTTIVSSAAGPVVILGGAGAGASRLRVQNVKVSHTALTHAGPLMRIDEGNDLFADGIEFIANGPSDSAIDVVGNSYNVRIRHLRTFNAFVNGVRVGLNGFPQNVFVEGDWGVGGTTGAAILLLSVGGCGIDGGEALLCGRGIQTFPGVGQLVRAVVVARTYIDSCTLEGMSISDNGGYVDEMSVVAAKILSNGFNGSAADKHDNVFIQASALGHVENLGFTACSFGNGGRHGVVTINASDVRFVGCSANGNGVAASGNGYYIGPGSREVTIDGGTAKGRFSSRGPSELVQQYAAAIEADTDYISIVNRANFRGNVVAPVANNSTGANNSIIGGSGYYS